MEFKNVSGDDLSLPARGVNVPAGGTVTATGDDADGLLGNPAFERVDKPVSRKSESKVEGE